MQQHRRWEIRATTERQLITDFGPKSRIPSKRQHYGRVTSPRMRVQQGKIAVYVEGDHPTRPSWLNHTALTVRAPNGDLLLTFKVFESESGIDYMPVSNGSLNTFNWSGGAWAHHLWGAFSRSGIILASWEGDEYVEAFGKNYKQTLMSLLLMVRCVDCERWTDGADRCEDCAKAGLIAIAESLG